MKPSVSNSNCITAPATSDLFKKIQSSNKGLKSVEDPKENTTPFEITDQEHEDAVITSEEEKIAEEVEPISVQE
jgi:PHD/YefM family antitoxin component YafN of YafNO toxin-antitoxin module